jgi:hypothetical protein
VVAEPNVLIVDSLAEPNRSNLRAIGPSLTQFGAEPAPESDPELRNGQGLID